MLTLDIQSILNSIPHQIPWQNIVQFEKLDDRVAIANNLCANIIGVNENTIEWCPNDEPPDRLETAAIAKEAPQELKQIISQYILQN
ncbi:MAG: hypothetical protein EAZ83_17090 [Oscillatoriales cyanobacterium]|nr:MAG: hypothetical protein EAZ83_17090 [Oscillatoriales cyanobacterium]